MATSNPAAAPLEYEERVPFYRRRVPRRAFSLVVGALVLSLAWYYTPSLKELSVASWHRRCAGYKAPAAQVVYDDDPATYRQLLTGANYAGIALRQDRQYAVRDNPEWQGYTTAQHGRGVAPVAYLGSRTSPGGNRRLVAVQFGTVYPDPKWNRIFFIPYVETTNVTGLRTTSVGAATGTRLELMRQPGDNLRILDGRPDPNDPSRFTIDIQVNGTTYTMDGQLRDNDTVTLTPRASSHVKYMGGVFWNPTGVPMFDWLSGAPGATIEPGTPSRSSIATRPADASGAKGTTGQTP